MGYHGANMPIQTESIYSLILKLFWCIESSSETISLSRFLVEPKISMIASVVLVTKIFLEVKTQRLIVSSFEDKPEIYSIRYNIKHVGSLYMYIYIYQCLTSINITHWDTNVFFIFHHFIPFCCNLRSIFVIENFLWWLRFWRLSFFYFLFFILILIIWRIQASDLAS